MNDRGFIPTVTGSHEEGGTLVLETLDNREETDLVSTGDGLKRRGDMMTEEQKEVLALHEKQ